MLTIGQTISHYSVVSKLGKGGMGEVYRAKDQKLGRDVAIKVLPEEFARDADRVARFEREAKLLASLNHPNIAAIHGLEESDGTHFLVLELVEGDTLADRIKGGPIAAEESLKLALQIAEALEAAHERGVIHRDLKPANIKVTPDGKAKVLDFGLAKAYAGDREEVNLTNSPTLSDVATQQGVILGTAAYMSPEQARGKSVDKRADIWAFGCVLYEMLTGQQTWSGATVTDIIAAALAKDVDLTKLPPDLHSDIRKLVSRCLEKDPTDRFRDVGDVRVEIKQILADPEGLFVQPVTAAEPRARVRTVLPWIAAIAVIAIITGIVGWYIRTPEPQQVMRFDYYLPEGQQFTTLQLPQIAVSPDGKQFVYATPEGLYMRSVEELAAKLIAGTEGRTVTPFFSPDGKWIAYASPNDRKLKRLSVNGGAPVVVCDLTRPIWGASWNEENTIVFGQQPGPIMRVSANGGTPEAVSEGPGAHLFPQILPGGEYLMYSADTGNRRVLIKSLNSGEIQELFPGFDARYLQTGHIIYRLEDNNNLFAVPFDLDTLEVTGGAVSIAEGILQYAVSDTGTLVCVPGTTGASSSGGRTLVWVDRDGKEQPLGADPDLYLFPKISPDGTRVAFTIIGENWDIWVWDLERKTRMRLTFDKGNDFQSIWTPDSKQILFFSMREGNAGAIFRKQADGTGEAEMLAADPDRLLIPWDMSSDGKTLVVIDTPEPNRQADISILSLEGDHERKRLLQTDEYLETQAKISPDGKWMAYFSDESGSNEIYVRSFPEVDKGRWQISANGGLSPIWAPNGSELFYFGADASVMTVAVETGTTFSAGTPRKLFASSPYFGGTPGDAGHPWDIHPDGKRFLMMKNASAEVNESTGGAPPKINIVLNWFKELKQRVPVK